MLCERFILMKLQLENCSGISIQSSVLEDRMDFEGFNCISQTLLWKSCSQISYYNRLEKNFCSRPAVQQCLAAGFCMLHFPLHFYKPFFLLFFQVLLDFSTGFHVEVIYFSLETLFLIKQNVTNEKITWKMLNLDTSEPED